MREVMTDKNRASRGPPLDRESDLLGMIAFSERPGTVQGTIDISSLELVAKILPDRIFSLDPFVLRSRNPLNAVVIWMISGKRLEELIVVVFCDGDLGQTQA